MSIMIKESLLENLSIYNDNLSVYYIGSVLLTILSVALAWWYHKYSLRKVESQRRFIAKQPEFEGSLDDSVECEREQQPEARDSDDEIMSKIKLGRQALLAEKIAARLTADQLKEEKEVEKQQLEAIFQLLQAQEEKFQVGSLQELQDQLRLYRP